MKIAYVLKIFSKLSETSKGRQQVLEGFSLDHCTKTRATLLAGSSPLHQYRMVRIRGVRVVGRKLRRRPS
jgi:hypothetical protein